MSAPTHPSSNPRDLSTLIALLRSSNQGLCLDAANEIDRLLRDNVDLMKACTARMYSTHEPSAGHWYAADDIDRSVRELDVLLNGLAGAAKQGKLCDIVGQVRKQGVTVQPPGTGLEKARDVVASVVKSLGGEARVGATLALNAIAEAMVGTRASEPPREGYSQAYADQMRTALLRIAGWREIDRNSLGERLREIEEIALAALMPTVTKSAESSPQGVQHGLAHREDETGRYSVPGEGTAL